MSERAVKQEKKPAKKQTKPVSEEKVSVKAKEKPAPAKAEKILSVKTEKPAPVKTKPVSDKTDKSESTELMKMQSTTFYGLMIEFFKDMKKQCLKYDVPFELFTLWNMNYNEGYEKLGHPEYKKPLLVPIMKKIAGHCVKPNLDLIDTPFTKFMKELKD